MAYKVTDECIACGTCSAECANQAIGEGEEIYAIAPERCSECVGVYETPRCAIVCPQQACVPDASHKETREELLEKWKKHHPGKAPAYV